MVKLSVVAVTKNAQSNIGEWLESVKWADEIVIYDLHSTDKTVTMCQRYPHCKVINGTSQEQLGPLRNLLLKESSGEWVLLLDPDEIVSRELAEEIREVIKDTAKSGYSISRQNMFLGKWMKDCGWWPDRVIRLTRKGKIGYPEELHSTIQPDKTKIGNLKKPLIHNSYISLEQYFTKFNFYTSELASEEFNKGTRISKKNILLLFLIKPVYWFLRKYLLQKGWRNGFRGFFICFSSALVIFTTYAKVWERQIGK